MEKTEMYVWVVYGDVTPNVFLAEREGLEYAYSMFHGCSYTTKYTRERNEYHIAFDINGDNYFVSIERRTLRRVE